MTAPSATRHAVSSYARTAQSRGDRAISWWGELIGGVEWTLPFIAFLYYMFVITTYWLPGADVAMVVALITLALRPSDWRIAPGLLYIGLFLAWCFVAWASSPYRSAAWEQTYTFLKVYLVALVAYNVIRTRAQLRFFLIFIVACFSLFPMRGAFFNYFGGYSVWGRALWNFAYSNPNDLAAYAILYAAMAFALFFLCRSSLIRLGAISSGSLMLVLIFFTQSRGALIAVGVVAVAAVIAKRRNTRVLLGAAGVMVLGVVLAPEGTFGRLAGIFGASASQGFKGADQEGSAEQRWQLLQVSVAVAKDYPLFGVGPGIYGVVHASYARQMASTLPLASGNRDPHNTIMKTAAETGYPGVALFLLMIASTMYRARKAARTYSDRRLAELIRFMLYGLAAYMLAGMFGSFTYLNVLYVTLALLESAMHVPKIDSAARTLPLRSRGNIRVPHRAIPQGS